MLPVSLQHARTHARLYLSSSFMLMAALYSNKWIYLKCYVAPYRRRFPCSLRLLWSMLQDSIWHVLLHMWSLYRKPGGRIVVFQMFSIYPSDPLSPPLCSAPQEADLYGLHQRMPFPSTFLLDLASGRCQQESKGVGLRSGHLFSWSPPCLVSVGWLHSSPWGSLSFPKTVAAWDLGICWPFFLFAPSDLGITRKVPKLPWYFYPSCFFKFPFTLPVFL